MVSLFVVVDQRASVRVVGRNVFPTFFSAIPSHRPLSQFEMEQRHI